MSDIRSIRLKRLHGQLGEVAYQLTQFRFAQITRTQTWRPAINAYRCGGCVAICVDLAGVDRKQIDLRVEPQRLLIRGHRQPPEPERKDCRAEQVLMMEVDYGPFEREVVLPAEIEPAQVTAEQKNGLLWIYLPLRAHA